MKKPWKNFSLVTDETGNQYGRLTVIKRGLGKTGGAYWECLCSCGNTITVYGNSLRCGSTKSCGCLQREIARNTQTTHGMTDTPEWSTWMSIRRRCLGKTCSIYKNYGGRGIKMCERWKTFENFYADMGKKPKGKSIDRIDNEGNYCKENCRWATPRQQANNRRRTIFVEFQGETRTLGEWCRHFSIPHNLAFNRLFQLNWSVEKTFTTPSRNANKYKNICWNKERNKYQVAICKNGKNKTIGRFASLEEAVKARNASPLFIPYNN